MHNALFSKQVLFAKKGIAKFKSSCFVLKKIVHFLILCRNDYSGCTARLSTRIHRKLCAEKFEIKTREMGKIITDRRIPKCGARFFGQAVTSRSFRRSNIEHTIGGIVKFSHTVSENER